MSTADSANGKNPKNLSPSYVSSCSESSCENENGSTESRKTCHALGVNTSDTGVDMIPVQHEQSRGTDSENDSNGLFRHPLTTIAGDNDTRLKVRNKSKASDPSSREEENEFLQARVLSLEAQIASLNSTLSEMMKQQKQQHGQFHQQNFDTFNITTGSLHDVASNISVTTIPEVDEPVDSSDDTQSLCTSSSNRPCEEIIATENSTAVDLDSSPEHAELQPVPDLEYRSFTPKLEEELRSFRKMSLDQTGENSVGGGSATINSNNKSATAEEEMNKENGMNASNFNGVKKEVPLDDSSTIRIVKNTNSTTKGSLIQVEICAEGNGNGNGNSNSRIEDDNQSVLSKSSKKTLPPSPEKAKRPPLPTSSTGTASKEPAPIPAPAPDPSTKKNEEMIKQMEERLNHNAIMGFIRGLNIDSRQQDGSATADVDANMEEFLRVPYKIENLLFFGLAICVDSFLNVLTVVPLKFIWSCLCLAGTIIRPNKGIGWCRFHRRHLYQLLRVFVIYFVYKFALCPISFGKVYHWIRGQAMLKLYVLMAMVEVFDRLMCSFGQDAMDSLYWNVTRRPYHHRLIASTLVCLIYAVTHSLILFVHAATLNVAMNSADSALMSLLIGGNFAEIKSTVFKKYNKQNLFKITTSDICERFKLVFFLGLVLLLNCSQGGMNQEMVNAYIAQSFFILFAEIICDWIKHSFITKFNFIKSSVYQDYSLVLAGDITGLGHESMHMDHCHAVVKRLGFAQIPLVCVMMRYVKEAVRFADTLTHDGDSNHVLYSFAVVWTNGSWHRISWWMFSTFICLVGIKFLLGWALTRRARSIILYAPVEASVDNSAPQRRQAV